MAHSLGLSFDDIMEQNVRKLQDRQKRDVIRATANGPAAAANAKGSSAWCRSRPMRRLIDGGIPASGLVAHTLISRFVDHLPYYRQETINARSGVHTPRSTLAATSGRAGAAMEPLYEAHKRFVLNCSVLHADETPVSMLDPGAGKTKRAYVWAYARGELDAERGVIYEFCLGRGSQYPVAFLGAAQGPPGSSLQDQPAWQGTLVCDQYAGYDRALDRRVYPQRIEQ